MKSILQIIALILTIVTGGIFLHDRQKKKKEREELKEEKDCNCS